MRTLAFAARNLVRQPARATLAMLGIAAAGALLFDMLLLSDGMIVSMGQLLERTGFDVRVTTTPEMPRTAPSMEDANKTVEAIRRLPDVSTVLAVRFGDVTIERSRDSGLGARGSRESGKNHEDSLNGTFQGILGTTHPWSVVEGTDIGGDRNNVVVNRALAADLGVGPGSELLVNASCESAFDAAPRARFHVSGVVAFPFEVTGERVIGGALETLEEACGTERRDRADLVLVTSKGRPDVVVGEISRIRPDLHAATNAQMLGRIEGAGFSYFRQISTVLTTVTVAFALLLICVLLTVSVNQRLGEIAALRAIGFSRRRVVADVLSESALMVGIGGALSLPFGLVLAIGLDRILKNLPNIPTDLHFFVFEPRALVVHVSLLVVTACVAALYPMRIVARLPIAATLRAEVIS
jgi:putative ABC transport system permease protein